MTVAYIGIGSNVGDRTSFCRAAVDALKEKDGITVDAVSSLYETEPIGGPPQRSFINMAIRVHTDLDAKGLLTACKDIERRIGREPSDIRWGPRVVDLDLLTFGEDKIVEPDLEVPHAHIRERRFVLVPLLEIDSDLRDPWGDPYASSLDDVEGAVELAEPF